MRYLLKVSVRLVSSEPGKAGLPASSFDFQRVGFAAPTQVVVVEMVLATTKTIKGLASATTIDFHISGVEIS